ncbi:PA14 domain-containing protein [Roseovarius sp. CAU 1744]|uniref:PA14 domain-containing protein n=1 Tax=Roseovarius sp. CAU 1744 TaxID=3140368 RepID=UPI00325B4FE1
MEDHAFDQGGPEEFGPEADDLKKQATAQSRQASQHNPEDQSRGTLHYGEAHEGETTGAEHQGAAVPADWSSPMSEAKGGDERPDDTETPPTVAAETDTDTVIADKVDTPADQQIKAEHPNASRAQQPQTEAFQSAPVDTAPAPQPAPAFGAEPAPMTDMDRFEERQADEQVEQARNDTTPENTPPPEISLSNAAIAARADGAVVGELSITGQGAGAAQGVTVSDDRFEVVGNQIKLKDGVSLKSEDAASVNLEVTVTHGGAPVTQSFEITVAEMPEIGVGAGFHARYFDMDQTIRSIDDVDWNGDVTHQELVDDINYENSANSFWKDGSADTFGVQITGNIEVEEGGVFNFHIGGDDGVVLYIDGQEVVENDGLHSFRTRSGEVELDPGTHVIEVRYFENYGHAGLKVEWDGPGLDGRELLTPPSVDDLQTVNGMPMSVRVNADLPQSADTTYSQAIEGLPPGTVVRAGDEVVNVDDSGAAEITGWDTSLLQVTPPVDFTGQVDAQITTTATLANGDTAVSVQDLAFNVDQADIAPPVVEIQGGFRASYFDVDHSLRKLDQIDWDGTPTKEEVVGDINYANGKGSFWEGGDTDTFGARITGEISVDEAGRFEFFAGGDDGVVLYVNGVEVIDNDGLHGYRTRSGEIELEPGTHEIEVRYFENYGHAGLKLEWEGPGIDGRALVTANTDLAVPENGTLEMRFATSDMDGDATVLVSGLPADTILVSGADTLVADGSDLDLSGWDLDLVELMPPPGFEGVIKAEVSFTDTAFNGAPVHTSQVFEIEVGDTGAAPMADTGDVDILLAEARPDDAGNRGWIDVPADPQGGDGAQDQDDEIMNEPVADPQLAEHSFDVTDTYERNDW